MQCPNNQKPASKSINIQIISNQKPNLQRKTTRRSSASRIASPKPTVCKAPALKKTQSQNNLHSQPQPKWCALKALIYKAAASESQAAKTTLVCQKFNLNLEFAPACYTSTWQLRQHALPELGHGTNTLYLYLEITPRRSTSTQNMYQHARPQLDKWNK